MLRSLRTVELSAATAIDPVRLGASVPQAVTLLLRWRPAALFTTGGYVAMPMLAAAAMLRIPTLLWEGNAIPGRSVRATARLASALAVSFADACRALPGRCYVTGTPIRELPADRAAARARLGLPAGARILLVFGGSQAVRRLNDAVAGSITRLVERCHVLHVSGEPAYADALRRRESLPEGLRTRYRPVPFLRDEMADALVSADLVVGRAGSSTLAECTAAGVPVVVVPYPHAGGHQGANAELLAAAGAVRVVADEVFDADELVRTAALLDDPESHARMATASRTMGRPGAADANVELLLALAERRALPARETVARIARGTTGDREPAPGARVFVAPAGLP